MNAPPTIGPIALAIAKTAPKDARRADRCSSLVVSAMITNTEVKILGHSSSVARVKLNNEDVHGSAYTCNCSSEDQYVDTRTDTAYKAPQFEEEDTDKVDNFGGADCEKLTDGKHESSLC